MLGGVGQEYVFPCAVSICVTLVYQNTPATVNCKGKTGYDSILTSSWLTVRTELAWTTLDTGEGKNVTYGFPRHSMFVLICAVRLGRASFIPCVFRIRIQTLHRLAPLPSCPPRAHNPLKVCNLPTPLTCILLCPDPASDIESHSPPSSQLADEGADRVADRGDRGADHGPNGGAMGEHLVRLSIPLTHSR